MSHHVNSSKSCPSGAGNYIPLRRCVEPLRFSRSAYYKWLKSEVPKREKEN